MTLLSACSSERLPRQPADALLTEDVVHDGLAVEAPRHTPGKVMLLQRLFISGHSLVDEPFPQQLSEIAAALNRPLEWERHHLLGSSIRDRSEFPIPEGRFDALLVTEQHGLVGSLVWNDTLQQLRSLHERMTAASPEQTTFFYVPWLSMDNKDDPRRWIAYERAAFHVWQCVATRINLDLAERGRPDRIVTIPANLALAYLIERIQLGTRVPGFEGTTYRASVDGLVADDVHLTPMGSHYMALVSYLGMTGAPGDVLQGDAQTRFFADIASQFLRERAREGRAMTLDGCRQFINESFHDDYWDYSRRSLVQSGISPLRAWWSVQRMRRQTSGAPALFLQ